MSLAPRAFAPGDRVLAADALERATARLAHEVAERHPGLAGVVLVAVREGGLPVGRRVRALLAELTGTAPPLAAIHVGDYRDDRPRPWRGAPPALEPVGAGTPPSIEGAVVVLVDDVIHTGRTLRAALDLLAHQGRPAAVEPLVLVDRGHRELPVRATYVGRNVPAPRGRWVELAWVEDVPEGAYLVDRAGA